MRRTWRRPPGPYRTTPPFPRRHITLPHELSITSGPDSTIVSLYMRHMRLD